LPRRYARNIVTVRLKQRKDQTGQDQKLARSNDFLHLDPAGKLVKSFATREQQDCRPPWSHGDPVGNAKVTAPSR
jgi:hypothetical protein